MKIKEIQFAQSVHLTNVSYTFARVTENNVFDIEYVPTEQKYIIKASLHTSNGPKSYETWVHAANVKYSKPMESVEPTNNNVSDSFNVESEAYNFSDVPQHLQDLAKDANEPAPGKARRGRTPKAK